jgi:hypothetical protein
MALHPHQVSVGTRLTTNRIFALFDVAVDGTLVGVRYDSDIAAVIGANFDLKINGVSIYPTTPDRPEIPDGSFFVEQAENEAVVKGDRIELACQFLAPFGSVGQKLYANVYIEDGLPTYFGGDSATDFAIGVGSKAFTTQEGLAYTVGSRVRIASLADPTVDYMEGVVTAYAGTTLTILVDLAAGAGNHTDWVFSLAGERGAIGAGGPAGPAGNDGQGVPVGGSINQVLAKNSSTNFDTSWVDRTKNTSITTSAAPTPNVNTTDVYTVTALDTNATFGAPTGTPVDGQALVIRVKDDGTPRTLAYNAVYRSVGASVPLITVASKWLYLGMIYNATNTKWDIIAAVVEA